MKVTRKNVRHESNPHHKACYPRRKSVECRFEDRRKDFRCLPVLDQQPPLCVQMTLAAFVCRVPVRTTSKMLILRFHVTQWWFLQGYRVRVNLHLLLTPSSQRDNAGTLNHYLPTRVCSLGRWISPMLILLRGYRQRSLSTRNLLQKTRGRR